MKIVIISPFFYKLHRGIEHYTFMISNELANLGYEVIIYSWEDKNNVNWGNLNSKIKIRKMPIIKYFKNFFAGIFYFIWMIMDKPQKTILFFLYHGEILLPKKYKYIYVLQSPSTQINVRYQYIKKHIGKFKNMCFVAPSSFVLNSAIDYINKNKIHKIPNAIDTNLYRPIINTDSNNSKIKIITTAAFEKRKGIQYVIRALASSNNFDFEYHIYGEGEFKNEIEVLILKFNLGDKVFIKEPVDNLHEVFPEYDVFVLLSEGEGFALSPLLALSCGIPILVSDHPPYDELIIDGIGLKVNKNDENEILKALHILRNYKFTNSKLIRETAIGYDWKNVARLYSKLIES